MCFNPHTHEGCDAGCRYKPLACYLVSIHTPTKGVTICFSAFCSQRQVSIHTPTKGVTFRCLAKVDEFAVSIHTPTKGVTPCRFKSYKTYPSFNPHTHEGCDRIDCCMPIESNSGFNPHTHEGCDFVLLISLYFILSFNPHTHEGCDTLMALTFMALILFQSTHPRRV